MKDSMGQWNSTTKEKGEIFIKKRLEDINRPKIITIHKYIQKSDQDISAIFSQEINHLKNFIRITGQKNEEEIVAVEFLKLLLQKVKKRDPYIKNLGEWPKSILLFWREYYNLLILNQINKLKLGNYKNTRYLKKGELEALLRLFLHFSGVKQKNYTQKHAENLQKVWIKLHSKYDILLQRINELQIENVLFEGLDKANTTGGLDNIQIYKLSKKTKLAYVFTTLKLGNTAKKEFYYYHHTKSDGNYSSKWYENFIKAGLKKNLVQHIDSMLKNLPYISTEKKKYIKQLLLLRYRFVQDSMGGDFLNKLNQQSKFNLEKSIAKSLANSRTYKYNVNVHMNGLIKLNQLVELFQNGGTRRITKNKNQHQRVSNDVLSAIEMKMKKAEKTCNFIVHASSFYPLLEVDNNQIYVSVKGFNLEKYNKGSQEYFIAKSLNSLIKEISENTAQEFGSNLKIQKFLQSDKTIVELITNYQRKLLNRMIKRGFIQEFTNYWDEKNSFFTFSTMSEQPETINKAVYRKLRIYSVFPYDIIQHWDFPTNNTLKELLKINTFPSKIWEDYHKSIFQLIKRKNFNKNMLEIKGEFQSNNIDIDKKGIAILKSTSSFICLPGSGMGNAHLFFGQKREKLVFTFVDEQGNVLTIPKRSRGVVLYYEFNHKLENKKNETYDGLILPLWVNWDNEILRVRFQCGKKRILKYWLSNLEMEYGLPKNIINKMKNGVVLNQVDTELMVVFVLICQIFVKNWDIHLEKMWKSREIRKWLKTENVEVLRDNDNKWTFIHQNTKMQVYPAIAKKRAKANKLQSGPFLIPHKNSILGKYIDNLVKRLKKLIRENPDDEAVKKISKWYEN